MNKDYVLIEGAGEKQNRKDNATLYHNLVETLNNGIPAVLYTFIDNGQCPELGESARLLVIPGQKSYGTLGLPLLDRQMTLRAEAIFNSSTPANTGIIEAKISWKTESGNTAVKILEDPLLPYKKLIVFGGGHIALPLVELSSFLGYQTIVIDDREELANKERFPKAARVICAPFASVFEKNMLEKDLNKLASIVIITRGHEHDKLCLENVINSNARYIGMIGSLDKTKATFARLLKEGFSKDTLSKVSAPIGLDLGGQEPVEIAFSILAQMIAYENKSTGRHMKEIKGMVL